MNSKIKKIKEKDLNDLAKKYNLNYIVLFGSRADGTAQADSDFDIAVSSRKELDFSDEFELGEKLAQMIGAKVDLLNITNAGPVLMKEVSDNGELIKEFTKNSYDNFEIFSFMSYIEARPLLRMKEEYIERNL